MLRRASAGARASSSFVPARRSSRDWPTRYARWLAYSDFAVLVVIFGTFWILARTLEFERVSWPDGPDLPYWVVIIAMEVLWFIALAAFDTRERHIVGNGPLEYARIARRMIEGAYGLDAPAGLTNYQVLWAWQAAENTAEFIGASSLADLRRGLAEELLRHYLTRAQDRPAIVITTDTTYDDLKADNIRTEH